MVYPVFEIGSIKTRCDSDIAQFTTVYKIRDETGFVLVTQPNNIKDLKEHIKKIVLYLNEQLNGGNYVDKIKDLEPSTQNQCWIARTYLFYQLLILTTVLLNNPEENQEEYNTMFAEKLSLFPFRKDIPGELKNFKMGIFGSITPMSDIDLGIQYSGTTLITPGLAYIIHAFESLFVLLTGKPNGSLAYDIETYADILTLTDATGTDYFYLDSSKFEEEHFKQMLPYVGNSIVRSLLLANNKIIIKFDDFKPKLLELKTNTGLLDNHLTNIITILSETWNNTTTNINKFLAAPYKEQRYEYYAKVNIAETEKFHITSNLVDSISKLTNENIVSLMQKISDSLTYRIESYICPSTVVHVVRILQASKNNPTKYKTISPTEFCNKLETNITTEPLCTIGKYGFIISMLEQVGNIHRFKLTYCEGGVHPDPDKCKKKLEKYETRYKNAIQWLGKYQQSNGGNPRKSRKHRKKSRKTKRKKNKRKYTR